MLCDHWIFRQRQRYLEKITLGMRSAVATEQEVKNSRKKGGESNEKKPITSMQPAPVLNTVLGRAIRESRRDGLQRSYRHHRLLSSKVPGDA
jgi:hypothetical protein